MSGISTRFQKPVFIVNPHSANGSTWRDWPEIAELVRRDFPQMSVQFTSAPYEAPAMTREALRSGADLIVSVGGDGTHNEVVNGFFEKDEAVSPNSVLGILSRGTGGDFRRTLGLGRCVGREMEGAVRALTSSRVSRCDVGKLTYLGHDELVAQRYFINICSFGIGGEVDYEVNRSSKRLGGKVSFLLGSARATLRYKNKNMRVLLDGEEIYHGPAYNVAVANGRFFGGGMMVAPHAEIDDGLFDVVICGDFSFMDSLNFGRTVYRGLHLGNKGVTVHRGRKVEAFSDERVLLDVDGEQPGRLDAALEVVPAALQVLRM